MSSKRRLRGSLYAALFAAALFSAVPGARAADASKDQQARERGWELFQQARKAFRAGGDPAPIHDYSFELLTQVHTPKGVSQLTSKTFVVFPTFVRQEIHTPQGIAVVVFDGEHGWQQAPAGRREMPDESAAQVRAELARNNVLIGREPDPTLVRYLGTEQVAGHPAEVVQIADVGGTLLRLFIDAETHDVVKHMFVGDTPQGLAQVEEIYSDFREVGGYRWYHHRTVIRNGETALESTRSNLQVNAGYERAALLGARPLL